MKSKLKANWQSLKSPETANQLFAGRTQVIFSVLLKLDQEVVLYDEVTDKTKLFKILEDKLSDYNITC